MLLPKERNRAFFRLCARLAAAGLVRGFGFGAALGNEFVGRAAPFGRRQVAVKIGA